MGSADLQTAFNAVASPAFTCEKATLGYAPPENGVQFQILTFSGRTAAGNGFEVKSDPLPHDADVNAVAADVARKLLDKPPAE